MVLLWRGNINLFLIQPEILDLKLPFPLHIFGDCIVEVTNLLKRTPTHFLHGLTLYEILFQKPPSYTQLRVFASLCYYTNTLPHENKYEHKAYKCVLISSHLLKIPTNKVLNLNTKKTCVTRVVPYIRKSIPF